MSLNMPYLHTAFSSNLDPNHLHTILLLSVHGAVIVSESLKPRNQRHRTTVTLAAAAVEAWSSSQIVEGSLVDDGRREDKKPEQDDALGRWVTVDTENIYVHPILKPVPSSSSSAHQTVDSIKFLIAVSGPADGGWELLEEMAKLLASRLAPTFAEYTDAPIEEPPVAPQRYPRG
ncbi:hypothetical protein FRB91_011777 [Serendipita sp. 411]|nr:hypothetical protein FRC15_010158 [Serendipita sp. 397]KAG8796589.1 hypothetical protein FRC16_009616 [Serendipita sp. 398]KAG8820882.1 hypothetical protein FRC19_008531 [Serendipita sp. 401]KAG8847429.1 hypothetical protein FRB91_011777 [Serendipita sp. 411]KAG8864980.1 hypothetical protein FRC20_010018 [Serendipita sp. 405]KAG9053316.1 hypothetical protein FS842_008356 [Serendipita sp. 407]